MYLIFDTETTGVPKNYNAPLTDFENWPRVIQLAWQLHDHEGNCVAHDTLLIKPEGFDIPFGSEQIHGISTALATNEGFPLEEVLNKFQAALQQTTYLIGHNVSFDNNVLGCEFLRLFGENPLEAFPVLDTCTESTAQLTKISGGPGGKFKLPKLTELYQHLFKEDFEEAHNASADVEATARCFFELMRLGHFEPKELGLTPQQLHEFINLHQDSVPLLGLTHQNLKKASEKYRENAQPELSSSDLDENEERLKSARYVHLHNHTHFTLLQSPTSPERLAQVAFEQNMPAVALTDNSNMMGAFNFIKEVNELNKSIENEQTPFKPIIGCELNICTDHLDKSTKDNGYTIVFLAKNKQGYHNLAKLSSIAQTKGFYYVPRIDKEVLLKYKDHLIVLSGDINGEIPNKLLNQGENQAEEALIWWKTHFGENFYIELNRHHHDYEARVNQSLIELAKKHEVQLVATNNSFYAEPEEARAQDVLLCIKDNEKISTPIGRGRGYRYGLNNEEYSLKSDAEMKELFKDLPEAILNTQKIADSIEAFQLKREVLLPKFEIPKEFIDSEDEKDGGKRGENKYLRHLTYEGAKERYGKELSEEIQERLDFELQTIENTGYPGYFLIVWDLIKEARKMGVSVGPGRGSAAGSAVAYCLKITNIDPIEYNLLFERFLNPDRISLPDIDIDFDDELRDKVLQYVIEKYGSNQVAQIITYGTMAAKSAVRDTARVMEMDFSESDKLAKLIPTNCSLNDIFNKPESELKSSMRNEEFEKVQQLRQIYESDSLSGKVLQEAEKLEGSLRNFGVHACGVIITPDDLTNFVPISRAKDSEISVTQFDNKVVESAGLLKMDFLGLKTLSQIRDTLEIIKERHQKNIDIEQIPLDDAKTYELFQKGDTVGIFQYESAGMQKYLKSLKPTSFDDLIAMNALYRPGPMDYIPSFVNRKHGIEPIEYDLPEMEEYLSETYGITVYQEQVMLLSQKLAGFTKGEADKLRKAIGKKLREDIDLLKPKFIEQAKDKGHPEEKLEKIWTDWEKFASYAFNKSHSTCYAYIAYQTAYLKAHYPAEFMAATMSGCMNNIKDITKFMEASRKSGIAILGPDVNESNFKFTVNNKGAIRFGMGAVKGLGFGAVQTIVEHRQEEAYQSIFDFAKKIDLRAANKKAFESLSLSGAFDGILPPNTHRAQLFQETDNGQNFLEKVIRFGVKFQENKNNAQMSIFGEESNITFPEPEIPDCEPWNTLETLKREREVVGVYISGHPLDDYKHELRFFCNARLKHFAQLEALMGKDITFAGLITSAEHRLTKNNQGYAIFTVEDYQDSYEFRIFRDDYLKNKHMLSPNTFVYIQANVTQGWTRNPEDKAEPQINIKQISPLQEVLEKKAQELYIKVDVNDFNQDKTNRLIEIITRFRGDKKVVLELFDAGESWAVDAFSRKHKVSANYEMLDALSDESVEFILN